MFQIRRTALHLVRQESAPCYALHLDARSTESDEPRQTSGPRSIAKPSQISMVTRAGPQSIVSNSAIVACSSVLATGMAAFEGRPFPSGSARIPHRDDSF